MLMSNIYAQITRNKCFMCFMSQEIV